MANFPRDHLPPAPATHFHGCRKKELGYDHGEGGEKPHKTLGSETVESVTGRIPACFSLIMNETAGRRPSFTAHVRTVNRADQRFPVDVWGYMYACSLHGDATTFQGKLQT